MYRSYLTATIIAFLIPLHGYAQENNSTQDSEQEEVIVQNDDTPIIEEKEQEEEQPQIAYTYQIDHDSITDLLKRSKILYEEQKTEESLKLLGLILNYAKKHNLDSEQISAFINIANIKYHLKDNISAITHFQEALSLLEKSTSKKRLSYVYGRLSYLYFKSDLALSKTYLELAADENIEKNNKQLLAENYYNLAVIYKKLGFLEKSKDAKLKYEKLAKKIKNKKFYKLSEEEETIEYRYEIASPEGKNYIKTEYADIQILNKIDGFSYKFESRIGSKINFRTIEIITRSCLKSPPEALPENMLLLEVNDLSNDNKTIFNGWMFSSSPSLNSVEHPVYDIRVLDCKFKHI